MQNSTHACDAAADAVCAPDTLLSALASIVGLGMPVIMLGLTLWLTSRFWYQLKSGALGAATTTILAGYMSLFVLGVISAIVAVTGAINWGVLMISLTFPWFIVAFVYTPIWLIALLIFYATKKQIS